MRAQEVAQYRRVEIETATPLRRVVMLYDGAMEFCRQASQAIRDGKIEAKTRAVDKSLAVIGELQGSLDMDQGGEIANSLNALYAYMCEQIVEASVRSDPQPIGHVNDLLATLRSAWHEIATQPQATESAAAATPPPYNDVASDPQASRLSITT